MAPVPSKLTGDVRLVKIAREIAIDHHEIEHISRVYDVSEEEWQALQQNERFKAILRSEIEAWQGAGNTNERVKLKTAALIEEWLIEASERLHDKNENLPAKVELAKLLARLGGMGLDKANIESGSSEKFSVTINIGEKQLRVERDVTPQVIEGEAV